ncbi:hypothetical protein RGQ13_07570 [Thalassotalea psychrophila]|uniref:Outer membrane protein beta-barrel domain-containing protein n=1 Tax=Thalassotalea psychrophila TaxID=3065647 RepID=A0ABY9TZ28_9GAMM|nr:hypothetical protein RGQ13_07570 [Colwelliaceae bacterium SQ149]
MKEVKTITSSMLAVLALTNVALSSSAKADEWQFEATPYVWAAANEGSAGAYGLGPNGDINPPPTDIDINFQDLIDSTDLGTMLNFAAKKDRWLLFTEFTYLEVSDQATKSFTGPTGSSSAEIDLEISGTVLDVAGGYQFVEQDRFQMYGYAGVRYMDLDTDISIDAPGGVLPSEITMGDSWTDGFVGVHTAWQFSDNFSFNTRLEVGGLGDVDEAYMAHIAINHQVSENWQIKYFYRYQKVDYKGDGFIYDMEITGPGVGVTYTF